MSATYTGDDPLAGTEFGKTMWSQVTEAAERHNDPGAFSAIIGFEWTSMPGGNNLHRNVIFRDGKELADQIVPISAYDTEDAEELWQWMADYEAATGGKVLAIPHGGNLSNGLMFDDVTLTPTRAASVRSRRRRKCCQRNTPARPGCAASPTSTSSGSIRSSSASSDRPTPIPASPLPRRTTSSARSRSSSRPPPDPLRGADHRPLHPRRPERRPDPRHGARLGPRRCLGARKHP